VEGELVDEAEGAFEEGVPLDDGEFASLGVFEDASGLFGVLH
jgi:hypothetical protein